MQERYDINQLLVLRRLTRAVSDLLRGQLKEHLSTLAPLLRPKTVLGSYIQSAVKEMPKGADAAFKELQSLYETIAPSNPYNLSKELTSPIEILNATLEFTPLEYIHAARTEQESTTITVTSPLTWVLNYSGFAPGRLRELLKDRNRSGDELREFVLHHLVLHVLMTKQTGVTKILDALYFRVSSNRSPEFGDLPLTYITSCVSTIRPPDDVLIQSTEISGMNVFEEIINVDDIVKMHDPLRNRLIEIVKGHGDNLLPEPHES